MQFRETIRTLKYRFRMWRLGVSERYIRQAFATITDQFEGDWIALPPIPGHARIEFKAWGNEIHIRERRANIDWSTHVQCPEGRLYILPREKPLTDEYYSRVYECVIKENRYGQIYVDEWREETREVVLEYSALHTTNWWEVYRSGERVESVKFVEYLRILYGSGQALGAKHTSNFNQAVLGLHEEEHL